MNEQHLHFLADWLAQPLAVEPQALARLFSILQISGGDASLQAAAASTPRRNGFATAGDGTAVIGVSGFITQRDGFLQWLGLGTSCGTVSQQLRAAVADSSIRRIVIAIDSPGGGVYGVQELGDEILAARQHKPVIGIADALAASAGYWLLSQCSKAYVTPSGEVGSIGVYSTHEDTSGALQRLGLKVTLSSAGKYKVEGNPFEPLSAEGKAYADKRVQDYYRMFAQAVARGRGVGVDSVTGGMGEGRVLGAPDALRERMVDGVATLSDVLVGRAGDAGASATRADVHAWRRAEIARLQRDRPALEAAKRRLAIVEAQ